MSESIATTEEAGTDSLRVLLVDDHDLFRTGLRSLLEEQGVDVVGEAETGTQALRKIREVAPEVVVMEETAAEEQISGVIDKLVRLGFDIHRSTGVRHTVLGAVGEHDIDWRRPVVRAAGLLRWPLGDRGGLSPLVDGLAPLPQRHRLAARPPLLRVLRAPPSCLRLGHLGHQGLDFVPSGQTGMAQSRRPQARLPRPDSLRLLLHRKPVAV